MAKAKRTKYVSKGQRKNSKLKAAAPKPQVGDDHNAIKSAFLAAQINDSIRFSYMGNAIIKAVQAPVKRSADAIRGWSASLSFKTHKALKEQGILV
jgi:hypothetical protein